ncbi:MAG: DNA replication protein [Alphaproteobacteria bacterium]|nr:DNA replication protein [Alphaproteobacteria bacterium]
MTKLNTQFPFIFEPTKQYLLQDFMISHCNHHAYQTIKLWPNWPFFAMLIFGPKGSGKTHLAHIFTQHVCLSSSKPVQTEILQACDITLNKIPRIHAQNPCLVVENVSQKVDEEALFHLFNIYQNEGGYILFTSAQSFIQIPFKLPDLASRLKIVPAVPILQPDDQMLEALIVKLFSDRQITLTSEVLNYILQNMERSFAYAEKLVKQVDDLSLALKRAVTVPLVKQAMIELKNNFQQELF